MLLYTIGYNFTDHNEHKADDDQQTDSNVNDDQSYNFNTVDEQENFKDIDKDDAIETDENMDKNLTVKSDEVVQKHVTFDILSPVPLTNESLNRFPFDPFNSIKDEEDDSAVLDTGDDFYDNMEGTKR